MPPSPDTMPFGRHERWRRAAPWLAAAALLIAVLGAVFGPALVGRAGVDGASLLAYEDPIYQPRVPANPGPPDYDATPEIYNQPWDTLAWKELRAGQWPLWAANNAFGMPLLGSGQSAPFNPLKVLLAGGATGVPEAWFLVSRLAIAGVGSLLLARYFGLGARGGTLMALAYMGNGMFAYHFRYSDVSALIMLPWLLLAAEALLEAPEPGRMAIFGLAIGLTSFLGHPESAIFATAGAVASYAFGAIAQRRGPGAWAALAGACLVGIGLAAVTVLPFLELIRHAKSYLFDPVASEGEPLSLVQKFALIVLHLLSPTGRPNAFNFNAFVGIVPLFLAPLAWGSRVVRASIALLATAFSILLLCPPGQHIALLHPAPRAVYMLSLIAMAMAMLGGAGLERLATWSWRQAATFALVPGLLTVLLWWLERHAAAHHIGDFRLAEATSFAGLIVLLVVRAASRRAVVLVGLGALEIAWGLHIANPLQAPFAYTPTPIIRYIMAQTGVFRITGGSAALWPNSNAMYGIDSIDAVDAFHSARYEAFMSALSGTDVTGCNLIGLYTPGKGERTLRIRAPLLDLANVRYMLDAPDQFGLYRLRRFLANYPVVMRQGRVTLHEDPTAMPRAFVVYAADYLPRGIARARALLSATPERWRTHVLIETPDGRPPNEGQDTPAALTPAKIVQRSAQTLSLEATLARPGWLVVSDAYYPGWKCRVDGKPTPIFPADVAFRGVYLRAGEHHVQFVYAPASFRVGLLTSLASLALALVLLLPFRALVRQPLPI